MTEPDYMTTLVYWVHPESKTIATDSWWYLHCFSGGLSSRGFYGWHCINEKEYTSLKKSGYHVS